VPVGCGAELLLRSIRASQERGTYQPGFFGVELVTLKRSNTGVAALLRNLGASHTFKIVAVYLPDAGRRY